MRQIYLGLVISIIVTNHLQAQSYKTAIITDVNYLVKQGGFVNKESFPFYFHHLEFVQDVHKDIQKYVQEKYKVDSVLFLQSDSIYYYESIAALKTKAKSKAISSSNKESIFISVETLVHEYSALPSTCIYHFTTTVKAYNAKGKKIYSFSNHIPFEVWSEEDIYGITQMKEEDFYAFYFDGLQYAFEGTLKKTDKRYIIQAPTNHYNGFCSQAEKICLRKTFSNYYFFRNDLYKVKRVLSSSEITENRMYFDKNLTEEYKLNKTLGKFKLSNRYSKNDCIISFIEGFEMDPNGKNPVKNINVFQQDSSLVLLGSFLYDQNYRMEGNSGTNYYTFEWKKNYEIAEVKVNNELIMLIKMLSEYDIIWVKNSISTKQLGEIINLMFAYNFASGIMLE